jgi:hypothetical protein
MGVKDAAMDQQLEMPLNDCRLIQVAASTSAMAPMAAIIQTADAGRQ